MTTSTLPPRIERLAAAVRRQGGEWTPARVARTYKAAGIDAPKGTTHKADLKRLHAIGVLDRCDQPGRTHYVPSRRTIEGQVAA